VDIEKEVNRMLSGDVTPRNEKVPFLKAKDLKKEMDTLATNGSVSDGDELLRRILMSLAKGRADEPKVVAQIANDLVQSGLYGKST
jgi:hypothetical protein